MTSSISFNIKQLLNGYLELLRVESAYFSDHIKHSAEKGRLNETHFTNILRRYLPKRFGIGSGFIVSTNPTKRWSHQCDIIIYDALNNGPLYESPAFSIYPIEIVYGVVEIKTDIRARTELDDCFRKCAHLRAMAQEYISEEDYNARLSVGNDKALRVDHTGRFALSFKKYRRHTAPDSNFPNEFYMHLSPRFFIFSYRGWKNATSFAKKFEDVTDRFPTAHIHGACVLNKTGSFYSSHIAYKQGREKIRPVMVKDGFSTFLLSMPKILDTMLLAYPQRLGNGFDMVDLERYNLLTSDSEPVLPYTLAG